MDSAFCLNVVIPPRRRQQPKRWVFTFVASPSRRVTERGALSKEEGLTTEDTVCLLFLCLFVLSFSSEAGYLPEKYTWLQFGKLIW